VSATAGLELDGMGDRGGNGGRDGDVVNHQQGISRSRSASLADFPPLPTDDLGGGGTSKGTDSGYTRDQDGAAS